MLRNLVRQSGVSFATRVVGLAVDLVNILLSRLLGPSSYGALTLSSSRVNQ
jgi:O-antigen/teichoic acid export membrane protein